MDTNLQQRLPIYPVIPVASNAAPAPNITIKPRTITTTASTSSSTTTTTTTTCIQTPTLAKTSTSTTITTPTTTATITAIAQRRAYMLLPIKDAIGSNNSAHRAVVPDAVANSRNQPAAIAVRSPAPQQPPVTSSLAIANTTTTANTTISTIGPTTTGRPRPAFKRGPYKKRPKKKDLRKVPLPLPSLSSSPEHRATSSDDEPPPVELNRRQDNPNSNFTTSERTFVLMALAIARDRLDIKPNWERPREGFGTQLCQEVREILDERAFKHVVRKSANYVNGERKSPSDNVIRDIWTNFLKNGTPARVSRGGRRKNEEARVQIKELLESGKYSSREVAAMTGVSRALVCNAIKEFKGSARKAARANKAAADGPNTSENAAGDAIAEGEQQQPRARPKATRGRGRPRKVKNPTTTTTEQISESILQNSDSAAPPHNHAAIQEGDISHYTDYC